MCPAAGILKSIPLSDIVVPKARRVLRNVAELANSIRAIGLLNPITVTEANVLVAGGHRLEAYRALGWTEIPAYVVTLADLDLQLATIDENLMRTELTVLERGEQLKARKEIYEAKFPTTKHGGVRGNQHIGGRRRQSETVSSCQTTARRGGVTTRSVQQDVQIAANLPRDVRESIRATPLANSKKELLALARLTPDVQRGVVARMTSGGTTAALRSESTPARGPDVALRSVLAAIETVRRSATTDGERALLDDVAARVEALR